MKKPARCWPWAHRWLGWHEAGLCWKYDGQHTFTQIGWYQLCDHYCGKFKFVKDWHGAKHPEWKRPWAGMRLP